MFKIFYLLLIFFPYILTIYGANDQFKRVSLQFPAYSPTKKHDDVYVIKKLRPGYIVGFEPSADSHRLLHLSLYGCTMAVPMNESQSEEVWQKFPCKWGSQILYGWTRNADSFKLPTDVGFPVGHFGDSIQYLVMNAHFIDRFVGDVRDFSAISVLLIEKKPQYFAGTYTLLDDRKQTIMPGQSAFFVNSSCQYTSSRTIFRPFAFLVHSHDLGRVISASVKSLNDGRWTEIGKRNPQWPQIFQMRYQLMEIHYGDIISMVCRFDSTKRKKPTPLDMNEMCSFWIMYLYNSDERAPFIPEYNLCNANNFAELVRSEYSAESTTLLPNNPALERMGTQFKGPFGVREHKRVYSLGTEQFGEISGLATDLNGNLVIFHRAGRKVDQRKFDANNMLRERSPITGHPILVVDVSKNSVELVAKYGSEMFYLPQSICVDNSGNLFTTDIGTHQLTKWTIKENALTPVWVLGKKFVPGSDQSHFCMPESVTVSPLDNSVFVVDGCEDKKVLQFSSDGQLLAKFESEPNNNNAFGGNLQANIFHPKIAIDGVQNRLFIADDKHQGRIRAFSLNSRELLFEIEEPKVYSTIYAMHHHKNLGLLFVAGFDVNISEFTTNKKEKKQSIEIYVVPPNSTLIQYSFRAHSSPFGNPLSLTANHNDHHHTVWMGDVNDLGIGLLWALEIVAEELNNSKNGVDDDEFTIVNEHLKRAHPMPIYVFIALIVGICAIFFKYFMRRHFERKKGFILLTNSFKEREESCTLLE